MPAERYLIWVNAGSGAAVCDNAMSTKKTLLALMIAIVAVVAFLAWTAWNSGSLGVAHIIGLGASVLILVLIWFWPGNKQPTQPPP